MIRHAFAAVSILFAAAVALDVQAHSGNTVDGVLFHQVRTVNPKLGSQPAAAVRNFYVRSEDDGHIVAVDLSAAQLPVGGVNALLKQRVRVTAAAGIAAQDLPLDQKLVAQRVDRLGAAQPDYFPVIGSRQYISLLCKWSDAPAFEPRTTTFFDNQLGSTYPGFNHYFAETSYGLADINGSGSMSQWVTMPHTRTFYDTGVDNGSYLHAMAQDCITAAEAYVNFTGYEGVNIMFNGLVDDCCAWGGSDFLTLDGSNRLVSVTWMPYWGEPPGEFGWLDHGVLAHELAHSFGSPHSNDPSGYQYGNFWDVVSRPGGTCATLYDATYGCIAQHAVGDNKLKMGHIPGARIATHAVGAGSTTYNIERMASPPNAGGSFQILKINTPDAHKYFTVEARKRTGYDQNLPGDGVIIMEVIDNRPFVSPTNPGDDARMLTPTGTVAANTGDIDARWSAGDSYIHAGNNVKITVMAFDGTTGTAQVKVEPATAPGEYTFALDSYTVTEGGPQVTVTVNRTAPYASAGSVTWTTANGTAISGTDFGVNANPANRTGTLTWTAGTGGAKTITLGMPASNIPVFNENAAEADENFTINLSSPVGGVLGAQSSTTVTVKDGAVIYFGAVTSQVGEIGGNVDVQVLRSGNLTGTNTVTFSTVPGTALYPSDYTSTTGNITFLPGQDTKTISVGSTMVAAPHIHVMDDALIEGPEAFTIRLSAPTNGAIVPNALKDNVVTILSNENGVSAAVSTASFAEGAGAQQIGVNRAGSTGAVDVNYTFANGTALNATHFTGVNGSLHWNDGETGLKYIPVTIADDGVVNANRAFTLTLSGATGATLVAPMSTAVTITDNDSTVQFTAPTIAAMENGTLTVTVMRSGTGSSIAAPATVTYTTVDGSALVGTDFGTLGVPVPLTGVLNWAGGVGGNKTFTIPLINDGVLEGAKTFTVDLSLPTGATVGDPDTITVTINDDEKGLRFVDAAYNVIETVSPSVAVKIRRTGVATAAASASWTTVNGTAVSGTDFGVLGNVAPRTGTVSWLANDTADKTITIPIITDAINQPDRSFTVTVTPVTGGLTLTAPATTTVTIQDDDIPPQSNVRFAATKYVVIEGTPNVQLTLERVDAGGGFGLSGSVKYSTVAGTALATSDYTTATNVVVNWGAADSANKVINIPIVNNATAEPPEFFKVNLSAPTPGIGLGTPNSAQVWIMDDDEVFPLDGVFPAALEVAAGATTGWHLSNDPGAYEGGFTLKSDPIDDGQNASIKMDGTFAAGNVSFRVKVSSEAGFDELQFWIDGVLMTRWSGTALTGWQMSPVYPLTANPHVLEWKYVKDGSVSVGLDAAYIDALLTPAFTP